MIGILLVVSLGLLVRGAFPYFQLAEILTLPYTKWSFYMATVKSPSPNGEVKSEAILTVEAILAAKDLKEEIIEIPEWNGAVKIRSFTKKQQQSIREMSTINDEIDTDRLEMFMFLRGVIEPEFSDDQYELLRDKSAGVIDRILNRVMELSGMTEEAKKAADKKFPTKR